MKTERTDAAYFKFPHDGPERISELLKCSELLESENARLRELITLLEVAGEGMGEECASSPHIAKWDAARDEVGLFLRLPNAEPNRTP